jgi:hypothetical protein
MDKADMRVRAHEGVPGVKMLRRRPLRGRFGKVLS